MEQNYNTQVTREDLHELKARMDAWTELLSDKLGKTLSDGQLTEITATFTDDDTLALNIHLGEKDWWRPVVRTGNDYRRLRSWVQTVEDWYNCHTTPMRQTQDDLDEAEARRKAYEQAELRKMERWAKMTPEQRAAAERIAAHNYNRELWWRTRK